MIEAVFLISLGVIGVALFVLIVGCAMAIRQLEEPPPPPRKPRRAPRIPRQ